jgi:hypothetical protein
LGVSTSNLTAGLLNAVWGSPPLDINGAPPYNSITNRPHHDVGGGVIGSTTTIPSPHRYPVYGSIAANRPLTLFAVIRLNGSTEKGVVIELSNNAGGDTGFGIGVGATATNATGNNLVGVRGGVGYVASGQAIGLGVHSIAMTTNGASSVEWFIDARRVSTTAAGSWNLTGGVGALVMFSHNSSATDAIANSTRVFFGCAWNRILTWSEIAKMHEDPYQIVRA